jgi:predicted ester cyclase
MEAGGIEDLVAVVHDDVIVDDWTAAGRVVVGLDGLITEILEPAQKAFSDTEYEIISIIGEADLVAVHARFSGVFSGAYLGCEPTMQRISWNFHDKFRVAEGKIAEMWFCSDTHAIMQQIGRSSAA